jgi:hypothetical protein
MMFPNVYALLQSAAAVTAIVGTKVGRHGSMPQETAAPYITWFVVADAPHDTLSEAPQSDFNTVQIDCWSDDDAEAAALARAVRDALDAAGHHNRVAVDLREPDTKLYRVGIEADLITQR